MFGFNVYEKPVEECLDYALQHKITHLEIDLNARHSLLRSFTPERIEHLQRLTAQTGIRFSFHTPIDLNLSGNYFIRRPYIKMLKAIIQLSHQLNAVHITCHIGHFHDVKPWPWQRRRMLKRAAHCIESVLEACGDSQVMVALENSASAFSEIEVHHLGDCLEDFDYLFGRLPSRQVGMCLDIGHANTNSGALAYLNHCNERISHIHFHDNHGVKDEHLCVGEGTAPWAELARELCKREAPLLCISECFNQPPHVSIARLQEYFAAAAKTSP